MRKLMSNKVIAVAVTLITFPTLILSYGYRFRIMGGAPAEIKRRPYHVRIGGCSGVIVAKNWVITAGHCMGSSDYVEAGSASYQAEQRRRVKRTVLHPNYEKIALSSSEEYHRYDVMLLELKRPFVFGENVQPLKIGSEIELRTGLMGVATGWGRMKEHGTPSMILNEVQLPIYDHRKCAQIYARNRVVLDETMLCAGYERGGKDACEGDSGGPFVVNGKLVGVSSFGKGCARAGMPGVWCNVVAVKDWIEMVIGNG